MRLAIVSDAWHPQVNGVVRTYQQTTRLLREAGHDIHMVTPQDCLTLPCPTYPDIRLAVRPYATLARSLDNYAPDAVHVATEGPLGHAAQRYCEHLGLSFSTAYHTQFPEYLRARLPVPETWSYAYLRRWHGRARSTMVTTPTLRKHLAGRGFGNLALWPRGVDTNVFRPRTLGEPRLFDGAGPHFVYMGRIAVEKNIEAFLDLDLPGTKHVIGGGPDLEMLRARYPRARFLGMKSGRDLARHVASADVFVFPSLTDTFGLVMLEAMACGVPVAAFPVMGPVDVVRHGVTGVLDEDLRTAALGALDLDPRDCIAAAGERTWRKATTQFLENLVSARPLAKAS